jgi:signal transduction histidine kinase
MALDRGRARAARGELEAAEEERQFARDVIEEIGNDMRAVLANLSSEMLAEHGLAIALSRHATLLSEVSGIRVSVDNHVEERMPPEIEMLLYRLVQEALANARKHAQASEITISLTNSWELDRRILHLTIVDNGKGFNIEEGLKRQAMGSGLGLRSMQQRIQAAGGDMRMTSGPSKGTMIEFSCPVHL